MANVWIKFPLPWSIWEGIGCTGRDLPQQIQGKKERSKVVAVDHVNSARPVAFKPTFLGGSLGSTAGSISFCLVSW